MKRYIVIAMLMGMVGCSADKNDVVYVDYGKVKSMSCGTTNCNIMADNGTLSIDVENLPSSPDVNDHLYVAHMSYPNKKAEMTCINNQCKLTKVCYTVMNGCM